MLFSFPPSVQQELQHDNLIKVLSKFIEKERLHLMFELLDHSIRDDMRQQPGDLESRLLRGYTFQLLRGVEYLHNANVRRLSLYHRTGSNSGGGKIPEPQSKSPWGPVCPQDFYFVNLGFEDLGTIMTQGTQAVCLVSLFGSVYFPRSSTGT